MLFFRRNKPKPIPKKINFIWLGDILDEEGRKNIENWKNINPDYEVRIWIDSSLFPTPPISPRAGDDTYLTSQTRYESFNIELQQFRNWANERKILIKDVNTTHDELFNREFYDDAVTGTHANFAEGSDIIRLHILLKEGGFYFDVKDVFPRKPLGEISPENGFLCRIKLEDGKVCNDALGSIPQSAITAKIMAKMDVNYLKLYKKIVSNDAQSGYRELYAHRTPIYGGPDLHQMDSRKSSTITNSGPGLLTTLLDEVIGPQIEKIFDDRNIPQEDRIGPDLFEIKMQCLKPYALGEEYIRLPKTQALSWGIGMLVKDLESFKQHMQYNLCTLYIEKIKKAFKPNLDENIINKLNVLTELSPILFTQLHKQFSGLNLPENETIVSLMQKLKEDEEDLTIYLNELTTNQECKKLDKNGMIPKLNDILLNIHAFGGFEEFMIQHVRKTNSLSVKLGI